MNALNPDQVILLPRFLAALAVSGFWHCRTCGKNDLRVGVNLLGLKSCPECASVNVAWCPPVFAPDLRPEGMERN